MKSRKKISRLPTLAGFLTLFPGLPAFLLNFSDSLYQKVSEKYSHSAVTSCDKVQILKKLKKSFFSHKSSPTQNHVTFLDFWRLQSHSEFNSTPFELKTKRRTASCRTLIVTFSLTGYHWQWSIVDFRKPCRLLRAIQSSWKWVKKLQWYSDENRYEPK